MMESVDRAVLLLQRVSELLVESRAIAQQLQVVPDDRSSADAADRVAYGILVATLDEGLVNTIRPLSMYSSDSAHRQGYSGENWLDEQQKKLGQGD